MGVLALGGITFKHVEWIKTRHLTAGIVDSHLQLGDIDKKSLHKN